MTFSSEYPDTYIRLQNLCEAIALAGAAATTEPRISIPFRESEGVCIFTCPMVGDAHRQGIPHGMRPFLDSVIANYYLQREILRDLRCKQHLAMENLGKALARVGAVHTPHALWIVAHSSPLNIPAILDRRISDYLEDERLRCEDLREGRKFAFTVKVPAAIRMIDEQPERAKRIIQNIITEAIAALADEGRRLR